MRDSDVDRDGILQMPHAQWSANGRQDTWYLKNEKAIFFLFFFSLSLFTNPCKATCKQELGVGGGTEHASIPSSPEGQIDDDMIDRVTFTDSLSEKRHQARGEATEPSRRQLTTHSARHVLES